MRFSGPTKAAYTAPQSFFPRAGWLVFVLDRRVGQFKVRGQAGYRKSGSLQQFLSHLNNLPFTFMPLVVSSTARITTFLFEI